MHVSVILEREDEALRKKADQAVGEIFEAAISMGGTLSSEHGIGLTKAKFLNLEVGRKEMAVMARIKRTLDPNKILNPGKFADDFADDK